MSLLSEQDRQTVSRHLSAITEPVTVLFFIRSSASSASFSASRAFLAETNFAPESGEPDQPITRTGMAGGASLRLLP